MEHKIVAKALSPSKMDDARLSQIMMLVAGLSLVAAFYLKGDLALNKNRSSQPPSDSQATAAPMYKTTNANNTVSDVVTKALAFKALLNSSQQSTLEMTYTTTLARKWSNLPCGSSCRNGIEFGNLSSAQLAAALEVIKAATGTNSNDGYDEFIQIRLAEADLHANGGGSGYDTTLRWIAFLNTPSDSGAWMLQFGGHHYAANISYNNGHVIGATPFFMGLEPTSFTWNNVTYAPLTDEHDALADMLASLTSSELTTAKLSATFSDCTMVPGESNGGNGTFPTTKVGISCSNLTTTQKNLVLAAIGHYVHDVDDTTAAAIMQVYTNEIDSTYIAFTGSGTSGNASSFLNTNSNYVRIDGPTVWVELACQNGVIYHNQIHYHTIWRDHSHDYGVDLSGDAIDVISSDSTSTGIIEVLPNNGLSVYPNPTNGQITFSFAKEVSNAHVYAISAGSGQIINIANYFTGTSMQFDASRLPAGMYILRVEDGKTAINGKFEKL